MIALMATSGPLVSSVAFSLESSSAFMTLTHELAC